MNDDIARREQYLPPGTRVRHRLEEEWEYGVVIHCWLSEEIHGYDCYVAFFGSELPIGVPRVKPYVLRYASTSLYVLA